jgi:hypothetical protein
MMTLPRPTGIASPSKFLISHPRPPLLDVSKKVTSQFSLSTPEVSLDHIFIYLPVWLVLCMNDLAILVAYDSKL